MARLMFVLFALFFCNIAQSAQDAQVRFTWAYVGDNALEFRLYCSETSGSYSSEYLTFAGDDNRVGDAFLADNTTWYCALTTVNVIGLESITKSDEAVVDLNFPNPPTGLRAQNIIIISIQ